MQRIEIPVHPNHTIDNNYTSTYTLRKILIVNFMHVVREIMIDIRVMINRQSTYVWYNQMVSLQIQGMFLDQHGVTCHNFIFIF